MMKNYKLMHICCILIIGIITFFLIWIYIQRLNLDYDSDGRYFSAEEGIVYYKQAKEVYGILVLFGLIFTGVLSIKLIKRK